MTDITLVDQGVWEKCAFRAGSGITQPGVCNTLEWHQCLKSVFFERERISLVDTRTRDQAAIFPYVVERKTIGVIPTVHVHPMTRSYATRPALLAEDLCKESVSRILEELSGQIKWNALHLILTEGSEDEKALRATLAESGYSYTISSREESPYMIFDEQNTPESYFAGLAKKFRYVINRGEKNLSKEGEVSWKLYRDGAQIDEYLRHLVAIERRSWKEEAGTSITRNPHQLEFYRAFAVKAAARDWLRAMVLFAGETPVAHVYGIAYNKVFENLKMSYDQAFRVCSPGHVIQRYLVNNLLEEGVQFYDWQGKSEPSKLKWTSDRYHRIAFLIFGKNSGGKLLRLSTNVAGRLRRSEP